MSTVLPENPDIKRAYERGKSSHRMNGPQPDFA
jgi:hypothetical protein